MIRQMRGSTSTKVTVYSHDELDQRANSFARTQGSDAAEDWCIQITTKNGVIVLTLAVDIWVGSASRGHVETRNTTLTVRG